MLAAIDVGRLYFAQRDLQRLANLAALDGAREIGGCRGPSADPQADADAAVRTSITRNGGSVDLLDNPGSAVELGVIEKAGGLRSFVQSEPDDAVAVNVILSRRSPARLLPAFSTGGGTMRAAAAAMSAPIGEISVGSSLLSLSSADSPLLNALLGGLLGGNLNLDAVSYKGLANAQVTLQGLLDAGVIAGDVDDLLNTRISAPAFLSAIAEALNGVDDGAAAVVAQVAALADPSRDILPGDILGIESGLENVAGSLPINVADLLNAVAIAAAEGAPVDLTLPVNIPGVASINAHLRFIEPPQIAVGRAGTDGQGQPRTLAHTAQGLVALDVNLLPTAVSLPGVGSVSLNPVLHLFLTLAEASASFDRLVCASPGRPDHEVTLGATTEAASLGIGQFDDIGGPNPQPVPGPPLVSTQIQLLTLPPIGLTVIASGGPVNVGSGETRELVYEGPFVPQIEQPSPDNTRSIGTALGPALNHALADLSGSLTLTTQLQLPAVGPLLQGLLDSVTAALTTAVVPALTAALDPVLAGLDSALLTPLLGILGLNVGAADVTVEAVRISEPDPFGAGNRPYVELITH